MEVLQRKILSGLLFTWLFESSFTLDFVSWFAFLFITNNYCKTSFNNKKWGVTTGPPIAALYH